MLRPNVFLNGPLGPTAQTLCIEFSRASTSDFTRHNNLRRASCFHEHESSIAAAGSQLAAVHPTFHIGRILSSHGSETKAKQRTNTHNTSRSASQPQATAPACNADTRLHTGPPAPKDLRQTHTPYARLHATAPFLQPGRASPPPHTACSTASRTRQCPQPLARA